MGRVWLESHIHALVCDRNVRTKHRSSLEPARAPVSLFDMKLKLAAGATLLLACGGGTERASTGGEDPRAPGDAADIAGGETSEFSGGDIDHCLVIASSEPLDLDSTDWAAWVALVEGRHESTLGWRRVFEADTVTGFEEHTRVALDVSVLGGRDVVYGAGDPSSKHAECEGLRVQQLELAIEITTADGSVAASYRDWFERSPDEEAAGGERLVAGRLNPDMNRDGVAFTGSLEIDISPAIDGGRALYPHVQFDAEGVRGALVPVLKSSDLREVVPIEGFFPDDPCRGSGRPVALDATLDFVEQTPRELFQRVADGWGAAPVAAVWTARDGSTTGAPPATEVTLRAGEPTHACVSGSYIQVHAPLTLTSADGRVNLTQSLATSVADDGGAMTEGQSAWLPAARFEGQMGISGVDFDGAEYGSVSLLNNLDYVDGKVEGTLDVAVWRGFEDEFDDGSADYPQLAWCTGESCRF
jgi:hypothetical protein